VHRRRVRVVIPIATGSPIEMDDDGLIHAIWLDDAQWHDGSHVVVALCGKWTDPGRVDEVEKDVDCMACLVDPRRHRDDE
jgi:hypothetical protein